MATLLTVTLLRHLMIRFEGVHKWFKKLHVLNDVNLTVKKGEVVVVAGDPGQGNQP